MNNNSAFIYFLLSPVLGIIEAFKNLQSSQARKVIFLFCLCFGFCFSVGTQRIEGSADGISMRMEFEQYKGMSDVPASWGVGDSNFISTDVDMSRYEVKSTLGLQVNDSTKMFLLKCVL